MHSIIFSLTPPSESEREKMRNWHEAAKYAYPSTETNAAIESIGRGAWMLTGGDALPALARMINVAEEGKVPYRVLFVQDATEWKHCPAAEKQ